MTKRSATTPSAVSLTVTSKGQVTLRKELLAHLGIEPGQRVDVEVLPGVVIRRGERVGIRGRVASHYAQVYHQAL